MAEDARVIIGWFAEYEDAVRWGGPQVPNPATAEWLAGEFLDASCCYYVLTNETGNVCGTYFLRYLPEECRTHLGRFAIAPDSRGKGLAKLMIDNALDTARSYGARTMTLKVFDQNHVARRVYDSAGFTATGESRFEERLGGNVISMALPVSA